jgi:hypothetical protein
MEAMEIENSTRKGASYGDSLVKRRKGINTNQVSCKMASRQR